MVEQVRVMDNDFFQTPDKVHVFREVFSHSGERQEPMVNNPNTLEARLWRIARENN